jgi:hypothetical protein
MASRKARNKGVEGDEPALGVVVDPPASEDEEDSLADEAGDDEGWEPSPSRFKGLSKGGQNKGKSWARSVVGRSFLTAGCLKETSPHCSSQREDEEEDEETHRWGQREEERPAWMADIVAEVSSSLRKELKGIVAGNQRGTSVTSKDIEDIRAAQRHADLQSEAACLSSEGAQLQFLVFGKIKSGVADAMRLLGAHKLLPTIKALEEVEKVADLRFDVIRKAGLSPGLWPAATLYERRMLAENANAKNDKVWEQCQVDAKAAKAQSRIASGEKRKSSGEAEGSRPQYRQLERGQPHPF